MLFLFTPVGFKQSLCLFLCILNFACANKVFKDEKDLLNFIQDETNGYIQTKSVNGIDFTLMYRPTDMLVKQELGDSININLVKQLRNKYSKYMYFCLSISKNNKELLSVVPRNRNEFGHMVKQLAFHMDKKVHMYTKSKDTLKMTDFIYPRMYGMSRSTNIMFVYKRESDKLKERYLNFTIEDLGVYTGEVKFKIPTETVNNEPLISF